MSLRATLPRSSALFLSEVVGDLDEGANFLNRLQPADIAELRRLGRSVTVARGEPVFLQGAPHEGIFLIESGAVRSYYTSPSGREITLAYWTAGHFVGGPEIFRGGLHIWSGLAVEECRLLYLSASLMRLLVERMPRFAVCLIEGLVAKSKCYCALIQMLGTRSAAERLAQLLIILGEVYGKREEGRLVVRRKLTHDQFAAIIGATRQWVTITLDRFQKRGIISTDRQTLVIERPDLLLGLVRG